MITSSIVKALIQLVWIASSSWHTTPFLAAAPKTIKEHMHNLPDASYIQSVKEWHKHHVLDTVVESNDIFQFVLAELWILVVHPIICALNLKVTDSSICPYPSLELIFITRNPSYPYACGGVQLASLPSFRYMQLENTPWSQTNACLNMQYYPIHLCCLHSSPLHPPIRSLSRWQWLYNLVHLAIPHCHIPLMN
jgi:hypothetical protein